MIYIYKSVNIMNETLTENAFDDLCDALDYFDDDRRTVFDLADVAEIGVYELNATKMTKRPVKTLARDSEEILYAFDEYDRALMSEVFPNARIRLA